MYIMCKYRYKYVSKNIRINAFYFKKRIWVNNKYTKWNKLLTEGQILHNIIYTRYIK